MRGTSRQATNKSVRCEIFLWFELFRDWLTIQFSALDDPQQAQSRALHLLGRTEGISLMGHVYNDPDFITTEIEILEQWIDAL